ncbi:5-oxoprolinase subunit B family protein [Nocardia australiensis]|uniref:5-oxoprolinase subunit B family protein n=1 Tax=Nocardia australiensis TaxID=2887191 RepID=UPI001D140FE7|nr:allophanate hydrolase subunit 1 [Nocardia australiensis]
MDSSERARLVTTDLEPAQLIRAAGDRALLITPAGHHSVAEVVAALRSSRVPGVQDILPAAETVLVTLLSVRDVEPVRTAMAKLLSAIYRQGQQQDSYIVLRGTISDDDDVVLIPVRYNGADLDDVCRLLQLSVPEVVAAHTETVWHCAFMGFAPGFGYLKSLDSRLSVPRRSAARTSIPAGAVALAGGYTAVYPSSTPGGWQLIGTTDLRMWDVDRDPPAMIRAGAAVRFIEAGRRG